MFDRLIEWFLDLFESHRRLKVEAYVDALTGISNRRAFDRALEREVARARRGFVPLAVMFIDIDHFKEVNTTFGHHVGDQVLAHFAQVIASAFPRSTDSVFRYGGEEFVCLLPATGIDGARKKADGVRATLQEQGRVQMEDGRTIVRTVSIGVTTWHDHESPKTLLARANGAMHEAKRIGRNRVVEL